MIRPLLLAALAAALPLAHAAAQSDDRIREERVQFAPGTSSAKVEGSIAGDGVVDYLLGAREGQRANISMAADSSTAYFNLIAPGEENVAFFVGSRSAAGNQFEGQLPASGDYRVRVYQMGAARDEGRTTGYRLEMIVENADGAAAEAPATALAAPEDGGPRQWQVTGVSTALNLRAGPSTAAESVATVPPGTILDNLGCEQAEGRAWCDVQPHGGGPRGYAAAEYLSPAAGPDGAVVTGENDSALRAGQGDFDATGTVPCAQTIGQPTTACDFGVARAGNGDATVVVTRPDGSTRALFFSRGAFQSADTSQADGYPEASATREADLTLIRVGEERYEIPDAVILGG